MRHLAAITAALTLLTTDAALAQRADDPLPSSWLDDPDGEFFREQESVSRRWLPALIYVNMDERRLAAEFDRADKCFHAISAAWTKADCGAGLEEVMQESDEGQYGVVAQLMTGAFTIARDRLARLNRDIRRLDAQLSATMLSADEASSQQGAPASTRDQR